MSGARNDQRSQPVLPDAVRHDLFTTGRSAVDQHDEPLPPLRVVSAGLSVSTDLREDRRGLIEQIDELRVTAAEAVAEVED
jgi:hypothetical protein